MTFAGLSYLEILYLQGNTLEVLPNEGFNGLSRLTILGISNNRIKRLFSKTFAGLSSLEILYLQKNKLEVLPNKGFNGLSRLKILDISNNRIKRLFLKTFAGLSSLEILKMQNNLLSLKNVPFNAFDGLKNLKELYVDEFILCCYAGDAATGTVKCRSPKNEFSSCFDLMKNRGVQVCVWILGLTCLLVKRMNRSVAYTVVGGVWVLGTMLAVIPILWFEYFYDKKRSVGFYGKSAVCLPLQLSAERMAGWEYAVGIFIGLNFVSFVYILVAYIVMFITVRNSSNKVRSTNLKRESQMARRMFFIVLTDFLCWMPVILIGLLSVLGKFHDPEKQAYIWIAVFVLPVNSWWSIAAGFVVACRENGKETAMRLIKHFSSECEDDWEKESGLVNVLGETEHPNILTYCWHCKAQECVLNFKQTLFPRLGKSAFLLCYDFPESTPLDEYLKNKKIVLNLDTLFVLAVDLIEAIQCLENTGIVHNNITTSTVLIAEGFR
ncbi:PREDICTED: G-protein coupled receptor GRL101-like, partial [Acropora digitifera]|uniref:G-protein coupled receptor GRL101-like n=1 Tax=Acropora digitifera TaxID=70779 RepID=UPI00077A5683